MMNARIFRLLIVLLISVAPLGGYAQKQEAQPSLKVFQGVYFSTDVFGYIYPIFVKDRYYSGEVSLTANLSNRFFPVVEAGVGYTDMVSTLYSIGYRTSAPYYRIGMDYNMQHKNGKPNYIYLGGRVGYTAFEYSVDAPALQDPVWGGEVPVRFSDVPSRAVWAEAVGGVRAEIINNFYMGWSLRYKYLLYQGAITNGGPWYIPGFGTGKKTVFTATYSLTYYFKL